MIYFGYFQTTVTISCLVGKPTLVNKMVYQKTGKQIFLTTFLLNVCLKSGTDVPDVSIASAMSRLVAFVPCQLGTPTKLSLLESLVVPLPVVYYKLLKVEPFVMPPFVSIEELQANILLDRVTGIFRFSSALHD